MQHVTDSAEDDYETTAFISEYGYYKSREIAKELSKHYGEVEVPFTSHKFIKRIPKADFPQQPLDEGLAMVKITVYTETPETSYEPLRYEYYKDGELYFKLEF